MNLWAFKSKFHELLRETERIGSELGGLIDRMIPNAREALAREDDLAVAASFLGQLIRIADAQSVEVPEHARKLFSELLDVTGAAASSMVRAMSALHPRASDVLEIHRGTERARYREARRDGRARSGRDRRRQWRDRRRKQDPERHGAVDCSGWRHRRSRKCSAPRPTARDGRSLTRFSRSWTRPECSWSATRRLAVVAAISIMSLDQTWLAVNGVEIGVRELLLRDIRRLKKRGDSAGFINILGHFRDPRKISSATPRLYLRGSQPVHRR
jgi:hypothetical protein